jgi:hypothetical protein
MKGRVLIIPAVVALVLSALGCGCGGIDIATVRFGEPRAVRGSGEVKTEERQVNDFTGVELATLGKLTIKLGEQEGLSIEAEDNLLEYFEVEVRGQVLRITTRDGVTIRNRRPVNYYLTVKELDNIRISSSGGVEAADLEAERFSVFISSSGDLDIGDLRASTLQVRISSSGDMKMGTLHADRIEVDITSSGDLDIAGGEVEKQDISLTSSGEYRARNLASDEAEVRLSSSGSATIQVRDYLQANLSSSGDLHYIGQPTVNTSTSSSGDVRQVSD